MMSFDEHLRLRTRTSFSSVHVSGGLCSVRSLSLCSYCIYLCPLKAVFTPECVCIFGVYSDGNDNHATPRWNSLDFRAYPPSPT